LAGGTSSSLASFVGGQGGQFFMQPPRDGHQLAELARGELTTCPACAQFFIQMGSTGPCECSGSSQRAILRWRDVRLSLSGLGSVGQRAAYALGATRGAAFAVPRGMFPDHYATSRSADRDATATRSGGDGRGAGGASPKATASAWRSCSASGRKTRAASGRGGVRRSGSVRGTLHLAIEPKRCEPALQFDGRQLPWLAALSEDARHIDAREATAPRVL
jgi:hypothetical protein